MRAMFEIAMNRNYAELAKMALEWCKLLDKRMRPGENPMRQFGKECSLDKLTNANANVPRFGYLSDDTLYRIDQFQIGLDDLYNNNFDELKRYCSGGQLDEMKKFLGYLPNLEV